MSYGFEIEVAIGSGTLDNLRALRLLASETVTKSTSSSKRTYSIPAPSGWSKETGTFFAAANDGKALPVLTPTSSGLSAEEVLATSYGFMSVNYNIYWLLKNSAPEYSGYGFSLTNNSGETIIDDKYPVLQVIEGGTLTSYTTATSPNNERLFSVPTSMDTQTDIIFLKIEDGRAISTIAGEYYGKNSPKIIADSGTSSIEYFLIRPAQLLTSKNGYGMEVWSNSGGLYYSSEYMIFPSNGEYLHMKSLYDDGDSVDIISSLDAWASFSFTYPNPFCPNPSVSPTYWLTTGLKRNGSKLDVQTLNAFTENSSVSQNPPGYPVVNIVQF